MVYEFLADAAFPGFDPLVRNAKGVAAGAVLISAIAAVRRVSLPGSPAGW